MVPGVIAGGGPVLTVQRIALLVHFGLQNLLRVVFVLLVALVGEKVSDLLTWLHYL